MTKSFSGALASAARHSVSRRDGMSVQRKNPSATERNPHSGVKNFKNNWAANELNTFKTPQTKIWNFCLSVWSQITNWNWCRCRVDSPGKAEKNGLEIHVVTSRACAPGFSEASLVSKHDFWFEKLLMLAAFVRILRNYIKILQVWKVYFSLQWGCLIRSNRGSRGSLHSVSILAAF